MDLKKLPRLSQTPAPPPDDVPVAQEAQPGDAQGAPAAKGSFCTNCGSALTPGVRFCGNCGAAVGSIQAPERYEEPMAGTGIAIFVALGLGLLFALLGWRYGQYLLASMSGKPFHTGVNWVAGPKVGQEVAYFELDGFTALSEMGYFWLAAALLFEAVAFTLAALKIRWSRLVMWVSVLVSAVALVINLYAVGRTVGAGMIPQISIVALLIAGLSLSYQVSVARAK